MESTRTKDKMQSEKHRMQTRLLTGKWHNQHNSEIEMKIDDQGYVFGTFSTYIKSSKKRASFPMSGYASNNLIAFSVGFPNYGSVTSWTGQLIKEPGESKASIHTLWHMALDLGDSAVGEPWRGTLSGADLFVKGEADLDNEIENMAPPSHPWWNNSDEA